jgi:hypothetical protein
LGDAAFINVLEEQFQLRLSRGKAGRPAKIKDMAKLISEIISGFGARIGRDNQEE